MKKLLKKSLGVNNSSDQTPTQKVVKTNVEFAISEFAKELADCRAEVNKLKQWVYDNLANQYGADYAFEVINNSDDSISNGFAELNRGLYFMLENLFFEENPEWVDEISPQHSLRRS
jgi:hypothetical protein